MKYLIILLITSVFLIHTVDAATYYVAPTGSNSNSGSSSSPWATIYHALDAISSAGGHTIIVRDGTYYLSGWGLSNYDFSSPVLLTAENPYQAILTNSPSGTGLLFGMGDSHNIIFEGFEITNQGASGGTYMIHITEGSSDIIFRNNIMHDNHYQDMIKINVWGTHDITFEGNVFYNVDDSGPWNFFDINGVSNIFVHDNILFNDRGGLSGAGGSWFVIKTSQSNPVDLVNNVQLKRNVFMGWDGAGIQGFILTGEDGYGYPEAENVLVENCLFIGDSAGPISGAFYSLGARDVVFRANTVTGNLPVGSRGYAAVLLGSGGAPNENFVFENNIWSDPTGTMVDLADGYPQYMNGLVQNNNLYWNDGNSIPTIEPSSMHPDNDLVNGVFADPRLNEDHSNIVYSEWSRGADAFISGETSIANEFERLVNLYGAIDSTSAAYNAANTNMPSDDILGNPRDNHPDIGAFEFGSTGSPGVCTDGQTRQCGTTDVGACEYGSQTCVDGYWSSCYSSIEPRTEDCSNNLDDDCDGLTDYDDSDDCAGPPPVCVSGQTRQCGTTDVGACAYGTETCVGGDWGSCYGSIVPRAEICDNSVDDDCDGLTDSADSDDCAGPPQEPPIDPPVDPSQPTELELQIKIVLQKSLWAFIDDQQELILPLNELKDLLIFYLETPVIDGSSLGAIGEHSGKSILDIFTEATLKIEDKRDPPIPGTRCTEGWKCRTDRLRVYQETNCEWRTDTAELCSTSCINGECVSPANTCGDMNHDGTVNSVDREYLVAYLFEGGPEPVPLWIANIDGVIRGGGPVDVSDLTYLVAYLNSGGPAPKCDDLATGLDIIAPTSGCGDINGNGRINMADVYYLKAYMFEGGPAPIPLSKGDMNADGSIDISDLTTISTYVGQNGAAPVCNTGPSPFIDCATEFGSGYWCGSYVDFRGQCNSQGDIRQRGAGCETTSDYGYCIKCGTAIELLDCKAEYGDDYWCGSWADWDIECDARGEAVQIAGMCNQAGENYCATCAENVIPVGVCGDGVLDSSETCDDMNMINGDGCNMNCRIEWGMGDHLTFVTSQAFRGYEVYGLDGADEKCNRLGKRFRRPFVAVLSDSNHDARNRLPPSGRILNVNGQELAREGNMLFPLKRIEELGVSMNLDEYGEPVKGLNPNEMIWWGSDMNGIRLPDSAQYQCGNWRSTSGGGHQIDILSPVTHTTRQGCYAGNPGHILCVATTGSINGVCGDGVVDAGIEQCDRGDQNGVICVPVNGQIRLHLNNIISQA